MALPKLDLPTFELTIPSTEQRVKYRPFLVKEEKVLMMALEGKDSREMANALKQIINNCCIDEVEVSKLAPFALEYFFLNLRSKSVGNTIDVKYNCQSEDCDAIQEIEIDVDKVEVHKDPNHNNKIELTDDVGIIMKYPEITTMSNQNFDADSVDDILGVIIDCMEAIYDESSVYKMKDTDKQETKEFLEGLTQTQFVKIRDFFETMPKIKYESDVVCGKCNHEFKLEIEGMQNFFG